MATVNSFKNTTLKVADAVLESFESMRTVSKEVNTQMLKGKFDPSTGSTTKFERPTDFNTIETSDGDISGSTKSNIITGSALGQVQNMLTVAVEIPVVEQALEAGNLMEKMKPAATRLVVDLERKFAAYAMKNTALLYGVPGTPVDDWEHVAGAGSVLDTTGVPADERWTYLINPYTQRKLANDTRGLGSAPPTDITDAQRRAILTDDYAGLRVMKSNTLATYTTDTVADRVGALAGTPTATYDSISDTFTQSLSVDSFGLNLVVKAGETIEVTGRNRLNLSTRDVILDETGTEVKWTATVIADVVLDGSGAGILVVTGPAVLEANGQYNTVDTALTNGDVVTLLGADSKIIQPNLFFHKNAFGIGAVEIPELFDTDSFFETEDGLRMRVSRYADGDKNLNKMRIDLWPAFVTFNPFFAGQGFGTV